MRDSDKEIVKMIDKQKACFISYIDDNGFPNTKVMPKPRKRNGIRELFFSVNASTKEVDALKSNPKACIYFCDTRLYKELMLKVNVEVIEEQAVKDMLWEKGDEVYYPEGKTDPAYCVLKITAVSGRYYINFKSEDFDV